MIQLTDNHWAVEVPDDADDLWLSDETQDHDACQHWILFYSKGNSQPLKSLPPGTWQFLFTTKEATEEQASKVVVMTHDTGFGRRFQEFKNYHTDNGPCFSATDSLQSLLRSKGLDVEKNYAIIQKQ